MSSGIKSNKELKEIEREIWDAIDLIRNELPVNELYLICLFLVLKEKGFLNPIGTDQIIFTQTDFHISLQELFSENEDYPDLEAIVDVFDSSIQSLHEITLYTLIKKINSLNQTTLSKNIKYIFDNVIYQIAKLEGRSGANFFQPIELTRLIYSLSDLKPNQIVYNPFGGLASFTSFLQDNIVYVGEDINKKIWALGQLRLIAYKKDRFCYFFNNDSINDWNKTGVQYDLIVAHPPFGFRISPDINNPTGEIKTAEQFIIEKGIETLKETGKLIVITSRGFLLRPGPEQAQRKKLIDNDLLETVISFPGGILLNTGVAVSILVINKNKSKKGFIQFVNANNFVTNLSNKEKQINDQDLYYDILNNSNNETNKSISKETVQEAQYNLNALFYFQKEIDGIPIREFASIVKTGRSGKNETGKFIRIRDLKDDPLNLKLELESIENGEIPRNSLKLTESALLVATRWKSLKPTYFEYKGEPIYVSPDIGVLKIDTEKINWEYLANELLSESVSEQLNSFRSTSAIPSVKKEDLLSLRIKNLSISEQSAKIKGLIEGHISEKKKEIEFLEKIHGLESEILEQNTYLRHSLSGPASNLKGSIENIIKIINEKIKSKIPDVMDLRISTMHNMTLGNYLELALRESKKVTKTINRTTQVQTLIQNKLLSPINIVSFVKAYIDELKDFNKNIFTITLQIDQEIFLDENSKEVGVSVLANEDLLRDLFNNFINNAEKHAFTGKRNNRIEIFITANTDETDKHYSDIVILISNTGKPFNNELSLDDFCRKGGKSGETAGEGYGGYLICEIIKYLNGKLDIIDETGPEGLLGTDLSTSFEITLPIIQAD